MLFHLSFINRHDGSVILKKVEAHSESMAIRIGTDNMKRRHFKLVSVEEIRVETINFGARRYVPA
jgi:hypothetical protein